ncbi:MAG: hypothetical protein JWN83_1863 [Chitinophagaceae bacterium]|nr:hypothetical protein [Chitinophagaceae bacterium]
MSLKVLYVDAVYPPEWLQQKQKESNLDQLSLHDYRNWIMNQRVYLSDYISSNLRNSGIDCEEIIVNDKLFIKKLSLYVKHKPVNSFEKSKTFKNKLRSILDISLLDLYYYIKGSFQQKRDNAIRKFCNYFQPDIIFVREPTGVNTSFWNLYRHRSLIVALIGSNTSHPQSWLSHNFDVIFSLTKEYNDFFKVQGIPSFIFSFGVDERVYRELSNVSEKKYDVTFVGLLGSGVQSEKSRLMEELAKNFNFRWWGPTNVEALVFPELFKCYHGVTSGIEMLQIYRQSKIVVNDYVNTSNGVAVNLRLYEVINTGSFLLTRYAENLSDIFPAGMLHTYKDAEECKTSIRYFLANEKDRETAAKNVTDWALENLAYKNKVLHISEILKQQYYYRFNKKITNKYI